MEWGSLLVGLLLGFVIGCLAAMNASQSKLTDTLLGMWRQALNEVGARLDKNEGIQVSILVGKTEMDDDGGDGAPEGKPTAPVDEWRFN
jgi:hypothetical protein